MLPSFAPRKIVLRERPVRAQRFVRCFQTHQPRLCPFGTQAALAIVAAWAGGSPLACRRAGSDRQANVSTSPRTIKVTANQRRQAL